MSDIISIAPRYTRSVHIRYDFHDLRTYPKGYLVTPLVRHTLERILRGLHADSRERAFSIIGPFGAGKSAFGLFLAHFLQRNPQQRHQMLGRLNADPRDLPLESPALLAVLIPGNNSSLRHAILLALLDALSRSRVTTPECRQLQQRITACTSDPNLDPVKVAALVADTARLLQSDGTYEGVFLVIDELGQYLDYAARHDEERDLFVLQSLAEMAARSAETPVIVVTILHQAFEHYTANAGNRRRIEWAKVQGRFVDLTFQEPLSQMIRMVAAALRPVAPDPLKAERISWSDRVVPITEELRLRPTEISSDEWCQIIADTFPLHPMTLLALPGIMRQLAQNERTLFAFLVSDEPWGLRDVLRQADVNGGPVPIYRLTHLFAYVEANLGASLFTRTRGQRWAELVEARSDLASADSALLDALTVIGVLNALERAAGLRACQEQVAFALTDHPDDAQVAAALRTLKERKHIIYRRYRDSFVLWEGSDLDLDELTLTTRRALTERLSVCQLLTRYADTTLRIAHRHSYQSGATRVFAVRYVDLTECQQSSALPAGYDGEILHIVPADEEEMALAEQWATDPTRAEETSRIVVLPQRVHELRDLALDVAALRTLVEEREELEHDRVARREVASRLLEAEQALREALQSAYGFQSRWFYRGQHRSLVNARQIDELLSTAADITYRLAPRIWNELIVRDTISSAAAKARRNLVEALLTYADCELLGISGYPPERAIYSSIFQLGKLHRQTETGAWEIGPPPPDDPLRLRPVWDALEATLLNAGDNPLPLTALYACLQQPPYGVKNGVASLLLVAFYIARAGEIAFYEHGNYVPIPDLAMFERLLARPDYFAVRLCQATGARRIVYQRLAKTFAPQALQQRVQPALIAVAMPLLRIYHRLPPYSKQTRRISQSAQAVRQALGEARAPDELLFELLPCACGVSLCSPLPLPEAALDRGDVDQEQLETFIDRLRASLHELQTIFPDLRRDIVDHVMVEFGLQGTPVQAHQLLLRRYQRIASLTNDPLLHALGARLETAPPDEESWAMSIAALVVKRPPEQWQDSDLPVFHATIADLARRFQSAETLALTVNHLPAEDNLLHVAITNGKGEVSRIVRLSTDATTQQLRHELSDVLRRYQTISHEQRISALATILDHLLSDEQPETRGVAHANEH